MAVQHDVAARLGDVGAVGAHVEPERDRQPRRAARELALGVDDADGLAAPPREVDALDDLARAQQDGRRAAGRARRRC